ncbi:MULTISPECIES: hypothetical protein [unclassified Micromonospora]|uniref:hypothetical protein n=1 Tax=unclassified Micromonospora TaxID=2617518 RepID=UPI003624D0FC
MTCIRTFAAAATLAAVALLPACASGDDEPQPAASASPTAKATATMPSTDAAGQPDYPPVGGAASRTPDAARPPAPIRPSPSGGADDRIGDLVPGRRTIAGTIERTDGWVLLHTSDGVWALLGQRAEPLQPGSPATVTGMVTSPPPGCPTDRALSVYGAR